MHHQRQTLLQQFRRVADILQKPSYAGLALLTAVVFACIALVIPLRSIFSLAFTFPVDSWGERITLLLGSVQAIPLNTTGEGITFILIISILTGINIALLTYFFRTRSQASGGSALGFAGMLSGILGIGCASCGSVLLSSVIGLSASWAVIGFLPLRGAEFSLLAIALLVYSIFSLSKKILPERIMVCDL